MYLYLYLYLNLVYLYLPTKNHPYLYLYFPIEKLLYLQSFFCICPNTAVAPTHEYYSLRLLQTQNLHNLMLSETSWDNKWQVGFDLVTGGLDLIIPDIYPRPTIEKKKKTKIGHSCLRKSVISPRKS